MSTLDSVIVKGLDASKPSAGIGGRIYFATDTHKAYYDDSSTWTDVTPSGTGLTNPMTAVGDLIVGGTSGTPGRLASSTSGYVLTANGAGVAPSWQAPSGGSGGALTLLGTYTGSATALLSMLTRNAAGQSGNLFQSDFDNYDIEIVDTTFTAALSPAIQISTDGSTFVSSSSYDYHVFNIFDSTSNSSGATTSWIQLFDSNDALAANTGLNGSLKLYNPMSTSHYKQFGGMITMLHSSVGALNRVIYGNYRGTSAVVGMAFVTNTSTFASITVHVYGRSK